MCNGKRIRANFIEKVTFKQRFEGGKWICMLIPKDKMSQAKGAASVCLVAGVCINHRRVYVLLC